MTPDYDYIAMLDKEVRGFLREVDQLVDFLLGRDRTEELLRASIASLEKAA